MYAFVPSIHVAIHSSTRIPTCRGICVVMKSVGDTQGQSFSKRDVKPQAQGYNSKSRSKAKQSYSTSSSKDGVATTETSRRRDVSTRAKSRQRQGGSEKYHEQEATDDGIDSHPLITKATCFATKTTLSLLPFPYSPPSIQLSTSESQPESTIDKSMAENTKVYVLCSKCNTAYLLGPQTSPVITQVVSTSTTLSCKECDTSFKCSATDLYIPATKARMRSLAFGQNGVDGVDASGTAVHPRHKAGEIICEHFGACSGCSLNKEVFLPPLAKELQAFAARTLNFRSLHHKKDGDREEEQVKIYGGKEYAWRTQAKLAVRPKSNTSSQVEIGLFRENTHKLVPIPNCYVHHPAINQAVRVIRECMDQNGIEAYDEKSGEGMVRYIQLTVERESNLVVLAIIWNADQFGETEPDSGRLIKSLWQRKEEAKLKAIWIHLNNAVGNSIMSSNRKKWKCLRSIESTTKSMSLDMGMTHETILGLVRVSFAPYSFRQANLDAFEELVKRAARFVPKQSKVVEYCAGVGVIGLSMLVLRDLKQIVCTEVNPLARDGFENSLRSLPEQYQNRAGFRASAMENSLGLIHDADVIIIDPPRSGLEVAFVQYLINKVNVRSKLRLIYISCGFPSFMRDSEQLLRSNMWTCTYVDGTVFFPGSNHVETLAVFDKRVLDEKSGFNRFASD